LEGLSRVGDEGGVSSRCEDICLLLRGEGQTERMNERGNCGYGDFFWNASRLENYFADNPHVLIVGSSVVWSGEACSFNGTGKGRRNVGGELVMITHYGRKSHDG